ncbi:hypothetical protein MAPG_07976 [Magnaporthiopsis poae ATCC 64411]|uniref:Uncharacterized protein n=1 Tax=Magnaporthiopsis poae (strain ATCC 64411 / 73-15) TaxID=644358 RepID=A0A0C4E645_MAGP6|nr:hypothetical protein MAPG_07976 [Magnaporthiopsis poae ATCC 64411]
MDDYIFQKIVQDCSNVTEATSYLEILNYSDPTMNTNEEHPLPMSEFENFIHRRGVFEPPSPKKGAKLLHGLRLVLQQKAQDPETFAPGVISFTAEEYETMVRGMRLPPRAIEGTAVVGPFFWCAMDHEDDADPHLHVIFRKSDVRKKGRTRGWELMLSHSFRTGITSGYAKGTESSDLVEAVRHVEGSPWSRLPLVPRERGGGPLGELDRAHRGMMARLDFYRSKLRGIENYAHTTLERLGIQRAALYNTLAQKESRLSLEIASQQRRLAHASKRDSNSMKTLSLLGAIFLPATFLASVFSMGFFDFKAQDGQPVVAASLWIYFALTVPLTLAIVVSWLVWDRRRERHYAEEDADLEIGIEKMELQIMAAMRQRTLSKVRTFGPVAKAGGLGQDPKDGGAVKVKEKD